MERQIQNNSGFNEVLSESNSWIVEDDQDAARVIQELLKSTGSSTRLFHSGKALLEALKAGAESPDIICLDLSLPDITGLDLLPSIKENIPHVPVIIITSNTSTLSIERAMQLGAHDYLPKNSDRTKFTTTFCRAVIYRKLNQNLAAIKEELQLAPQLGMYGVSPAIKDVIEKVKQFAPVDVNILVSGESGAGKELVARALHNISKRAQGSFTAINCAVLPKELIESELFGHERGSFTGAGSKHIGAFERAHGGTLFLDEIGELDPAVQAKLLRAIQERSFLRIGGAKEIASNFRLIVATNRDLLEEVAAGRFRNDLYYRLAVAEIHVPALRERSGDVCILAQHFVNEFSAQFEKQVLLSAEASIVLDRYAWPGNVRELQNVIQFAMIQCQEQVLRPLHLPPRICNFTYLASSVERQTQNDYGTNEPSDNTKIRSLDQQERDSIVEALRAAQGKINYAAKLLGISRATMYRKLDKYNISSRGQF